MSNVTELRNDGADALQIARAKHLHGLITAKRWSISAAALHIGMAKSTLASRFNGHTPFLLDDIAALADLIDRDPVDVYKEYLSVGPTGIEPMTSTV